MTLALGRYRATETDDGLVIHRVPIFCACERGEVEFDDKWIKKAVDKAKQAEEEGYLPPLHVRHHEPETEANNSVRAAGVFRILGTEKITFKGKSTTAVLADLIITDPLVRDEVLSKRLPYRSVEIFDVTKPAIDGLALLDHEAPFLELPMLMVSDVSDQRSRSERGPIGISSLVANATFGRDWSMEATQTESPMVACFRRGAHAHLLYREDETMADEIKTETEDEAKTAANFEKGEDSKADSQGPDSENMESDESSDSESSSTFDVAAIVKAIQSGEISVKDMDAIVAAVKAQEGEAPPEMDQTATVANTPAMAAAPGAEAMQKGDMSAEFAALKGQHEAMMADVETMKANTKREKDVAEAMQRLKDRPLGADLEDRLTNFHKEHPAAFSAYVDGLAKSTGILPDDKAEGFSGGGARVPEVAMKYQDQGADAVEKASEFHAIWQELHNSGMTRLSAERYVEINMGKAKVA